MTLPLASLQDKVALVTGGSTLAEYAGRSGPTAWTMQAKSRAYSS